MAIYLHFWASAPNSDVCAVLIASDNEMVVKTYLETRRFIV